MSGPYEDDDLLPISGLQHLAFCRRQWALIHLERLWAETDRTVEGHNLHEKADNPFIQESRGDLVVARAMPLASHALGLFGVADVVEFHQADSPQPGAAVTSSAGGEGILPSECREIEENRGRDGPETRGQDALATHSATAVPLSGREGLWMPRPVEYKRGKPKPDDRDQVQLCAQALCLEEMLRVAIPQGDLFYWQTRRRDPVDFTPGLRRRVRELAAEMHALFGSRSNPLPQYDARCRLCSMANLCLPRLHSRKARSVRRYLDGAYEPPT